MKRNVILREPIGDRHLHPICLANRVFGAVQVRISIIVKETLRYAQSDMA